MTIARHSTLRSVGCHRLTRQTVGLQHREETFPGEVSVGPAVTERTWPARAVTPCGRRSPFLDRASGTSYA